MPDPDFEPERWVDLFLVCDRSKQIALAEEFHRDRGVAQECWMRDHEERITDLRAQVEHWRKAAEEALPSDDEHERMRRVEWAHRILSEAREYSQPAAVAS